MPRGLRALRSHPHRHQHVERTLVVLVLHQGRRAGVGEAERGDVAFDLGGDVEEVAGVEADIEGVGGVFDLELLGPRIESEGARAATKRAAENLSGILAKLGA